MKTIILILACFALACACDDHEPGAPYGRADDISRYSGRDGYKSITYTYYCLHGQYVSVTYVRSDTCSDWEKESEFRTGGICMAKEGA